MIIRGYFAAPVRGADGDNVDDQTKELNTLIGVEIGQAIARAFPKLDLIIPHEHELIVHELWRGGVSSETIITAWCGVVKQCHILIVFAGNGISAGMRREIETATENNIPIFEFESWDEYTKEGLARVLSEIMENEVEE